EEIHPRPPLFGTAAVERAQIDMWVRRVGFVGMNPVRNFWRHTHPRTAKLVTQFPDFGNSNRAIYVDALKWIDLGLAERSFVAGAAYTMADICLLSTVDFAAWIGLKMPVELASLAAWHGRVSGRAGAKA
ncbi:MAG: glutathione S-transferase, partial [Acetobacteraceae bacterium]|nr:glutathione S-transferase [Acetobacteraceae bacterium]